MVTNIIVDGKWYLLLFREMAEFLVNKSQYDVYLSSYEEPLKKVTKENFEECNKKVEYYESIRTVGDSFLLELELPPLDIHFNTSKGECVINSMYMKNSQLYDKIN